MNNESRSDDGGITADISAVSGGVSGSVSTPHSTVEDPLASERKDWIDSASYLSLLAKWRKAEVGDPMFQGEVGDYFVKVMKEKRDADPEGAVLASKAIGWD
jgi:hypothetical protein